MTREELIATNKLIEDNEELKKHNEDLHGNVIGLQRKVNDLNNSILDKTKKLKIVSVLLAISIVVAGSIGYIYIGETDITKEQQSEIEKLNSRISIANDRLSEEYERGYDDGYKDGKTDASAGNVYYQDSNSDNESYDEYDAPDIYDGTIVYVTNTGSKYHQSWCHYLSESSNSMALTDAENAGYTPCSYCW